MEDGFNAGWRDIGRLALWSIPYVLGLAACVWLGFFIASRNFFNQLSQEQRRAIYVGAEHRPKSKLKIETPNEGPIHITRVDLDGSTAAVYFENTQPGRRRSITIHWQLISPDGTKLESSYDDSASIGGPDQLDQGEKGEVVFDDYSGIKLDNRAESIRFWVGSY